MLQRDVERAEEQIETLSGHIEALKQRRAALGQQLETLNNRLAQYQSQSQQLQVTLSLLRPFLYMLELILQRSGPSRLAYPGYRHSGAFCKASTCC